MAESSTVVAIRNKRDEVEEQITFLEGKIAELRAGLLHLNAVLGMFEGVPDHLPPSSHRMKLSKVFAPGEYLALSLDAIRAHGSPMTTSQIVAVVMARKGWDVNDLVLRRSVVKRLAEALKKACRRRAVGTSRMNQGVTVWKLP